MVERVSNFGALEGLMHKKSAIRDKKSPEAQISPHYGA